MSTPQDAGAHPDYLAIAEAVERAALELHEARLRARALIEGLEAAWRAHLAARREAERAGVLPPLFD